MTMPFHVKPFEKKVFEEVIFLFKYHQNPQVLKRQSIEKREKKYWKKGKQERKKEKGNRKAPRVSSNKGEVNILRGKKTSTSKILFDMIPFAPPPSYHFKNLFQNHWECFLNSFWTIRLLGNIYDLSCTLSLYPWAPHI
jgi:hypothetical protein